MTEIVIVDHYLFVGEVAIHDPWSRAAQRRMLDHPIISLLT
jgi:hypothetical protein